MLLSQPIQSQILHAWQICALNSVFLHCAGSPFKPYAAQFFLSKTALSKIYHLFQSYGLWEYHVLLPLMLTELINLDSCSLSSQWEFLILIPFSSWSYKYIYACIYERIPIGCEQLVISSKWFEMQVGGKDNY